MSLRRIAPPLRSRLLVGRLVHRRFRPRAHRFGYPIYLHLIDLEELEELKRRIPCFGVDRFNLVSLHARDHLGGGNGRSIRENLHDFLRRHGVDPTGTRIELLTHLRILGFVFNPVSFYYIHDQDGGLRAVVAEVHNTFGERHCHLLDERCAVAPRTFETDKKIFVSPFAQLAGGWRFRFSAPGPGRGLSVHMDAWDVRGDRFLDATLAGALRPLTPWSLLRALLRYPAMTVGVVAAIHWQALRLWLKRIPHFRHTSQRVEESP